MSMRVKVAMVIMVIVFAITAAYFLLSLSFTRQNIVQTIEQDLTLAIDIANDLIATKIGLLKSDANTVAERLLKTASDEEMEALMVSQIEEFHEFISLTVYGRNSIIVNCGEPVSHDVLLTENRYIEVAFNGERIISGAHYNSASGSFVMHVFVPMGDDRVLSATFPGLLFTSLVTGYKLWQTGNIFIVDETGTSIADHEHELVHKQRNFIREFKTSKENSGLSDFIQTMVSTEEGMGTYFYGGIERLCIYRHITGSRAGWRVAVAAPLSESPLIALRKDLLLSALWFLAAGVLISILASRFVSKPFYKIEEQNRSLAELNEMAVAASEAKSSFLANMSHEMRTPLNAVIGLSELTLNAGRLEEEDYLNLEKISNSGITLLSTVNDILDISKIEAGKFNLIPVEYHTPSLLNDTITQNIMRIGERPIQFILNIDEKMPERLYGDDLRVRQIFNNLLSNAFKYTREGTVELCVNHEREEETVWLIASVKDTGIGIREEDLNNLFGNFIQVDTKSHRKIEGTGLGLSITKKMAEMMEGTVTVKSEYGKGSIFTVKLRQKFVDDAPIGAEVIESLKKFQYSDQKRIQNSRLVRIKLPNARVLIVDDVVTNLDVAKGMMKPYGMHIDCVTSGQEAINAIRNEKVRYNAVFMDHMMPGMDGIEAVRIIREEIGTDYAKNVPIIAFTANALVGNEGMFLNKGFQSYISKPIEMARLDAVIMEWVRDKDTEITYSEINAEEQAHSGIDWQNLSKKISGLDVTKGIERFHGDKEVYLQVLQSYAGNTPPLLKSAKAVTEENLSDYAIVVHGLKSSSRGIGAEPVGVRAEALEKAAKEGNFEFVKANNAEFVEAAEKLVNALNDMFRKISSEKQKPKKDKPDRQLLLKLSGACKDYNIAEIEGIMSELDSFEYKFDKILIAWLRENVEQMNYEEIMEKLSGSGLL